MIDLHYNQINTLIMSYLERIIIGAIIVISAFELYNNTEERHQFHEAVRQIAELAGRCLGCYKCIEQYRQIVVIFVFTAGISLVLDTGIFLGILAQIVISALDFSTYRGQLTLPQIQGLLINLAIILFLLKNRSDQKSESKPEPKPVESKPTVAVKQQAQKNQSSGQPKEEAGKVAKGKGKK